MNNKIDLLKKYFKDFIIFYEIDADETAETSLAKALEEIQKEMCADSDVIEKIVLIFEKYNLILGTKHDCPRRLI